MRGHMRLRGLLSGAFALVAALAARADVRGVLHEPRAGEVLRGGTTATVSWSAPQLPKYVEEWEAFLSVDGGRYYAYRITPHLDIERRAFTFDVPNVETGDARILIRAGDEHREIEVETSQAFAIRRDSARALAAPQLEVVDDERGEAAREGERGVVEWIDGRRDGSDLETRSALQRTDTLDAAEIIVETSKPVEETGLQSIATPRRETSRVALAREREKERGAPRHRDLLLACSRLNI